MNIQGICRTWLNNADLVFNLGEFPSAATLHFYVVGMGKRVTFHCKGLAKFDVQLPPAGSRYLLVLETDVTLCAKMDLRDRFADPMVCDFSELAEDIWLIRLRSASLGCEIICETLEYDFYEFSEQQ